MMIEHLKELRARAIRMMEIAEWLGDRDQVHRCRNDAYLLWQEIARQS